MPEELTLLPCPACGASNVVMRVDTRAYGFLRSKGRRGICDQPMERPAPRPDVDDRAAEGAGVVLVSPQA